jgi:ketosteroid isomerase-like protein
MNFPECLRDPLMPRTFLTRCRDGAGKALVLVMLVSVMASGGCEQRVTRDGIKESAFRELMNRLADGWSRQDTEQALSCFTENAVYMEPPNIQFYEGHIQLRPYFAALKPGTFMRFHNLWFDESRQVGAGEYSFGESAATTADHGVVVVELRDGRIAFWREYQQKGPVSFDRFLDKNEKEWNWTIRNYPSPSF